jgi:hypothetical protein
MASSRRARGHGGARASSPPGSRASGAAGEHGEHAMVEVSIHCAPSRAHLLAVPPSAATEGPGRHSRRRR